MDLNIAISKIYPDAKYRLSKNDPPHDIVEWRDNRKKPTQTELDTAWNEYLEEEDKKDTLEAKIKNEGKKYQVLDAGNITEIYLLEELP